MNTAKGMQRNFKTATILFVVAALLMGISAVSISQQPVRKMFSILCVAFLISATLQLILYKRQKTLFKDRPTHPDQGGYK